MKVKELIELLKQRNPEAEIPRGFVFEMEIALSNPDLDNVPCINCGPTWWHCGSPTTGWTNWFKCSKCYAELPKSTNDYR